MRKYLSGYSYGAAVPSIEHQRWSDRRDALELTEDTRWSQLLVNLGLTEVDYRGRAGAGGGFVLCESRDDATALKDLAFDANIYVKINGCWVGRSLLG